LHSSSKAYNLPWHRILNSTGLISFPVGSAEFKKQKKLLLGEGVEFGENHQIDLQQFQWKKNPPKAKSQIKMFS
jgi:methylated-DNA-protein-cysteine methyltransferase-like protein